MGISGCRHCAGWASQGDSHAAQAWFALILHAICVRIFPDKITQTRRRPPDAHVQRAVLAATGQEGGGSGATIGIGITVTGVVANVAQRWLVARWQVAKDDQVGAWREIGKEIFAVGIGLVSQWGAVEQHRLVGGGVVERCQDACHPWFTRCALLAAIMVVVIPSPVAHRDGTDKTGVNGQIIAVAQRHNHLALHGIAIGGISATVGRGWRVAGRRAKGHGVGGVRRQLGEMVETAGVGGRHHCRAIRPGERNGHIGDAWFTRVLLPIAVQILPDKITQQQEQRWRWRLHQTSVDGVIVGRAQIHDHLTVAWGVAVGSTVPLIGRCKDQASGQDEGHNVLLIGGQVRKGVIAAVGRHRCCR